MALSSLEQFVRVRIKFGGTDHTKDAWNADRVGVWYGNWDLDEFKRAMALEKTNGWEKAVDALNATPGQAKLPWEIRKSFLDTSKRFFAMKRGEWVVVCFDVSKKDVGDIAKYGSVGSKICMARVCGDVEVDDHDVLHRPHEKGGVERFHYRRIDPKSKLVFDVADLPDVYRLIRPAGRSNVYHYSREYRHLLQVLCDGKTAEAVWRRYQDLPLVKWLEEMSAWEWESLCLGYLIQKEQFRPTGLIAGKTLPVFDMVGRSIHGNLILAQCKKSAKAYPPTDAFVREWGHITKASKTTTKQQPHGFWFAYGGCKDELPPGVRLVGKNEMLAWLESDGKDYLELFRNRLLSDA